VQNEGYIFIRGSTWITLDNVVGQTGWDAWMGGQGVLYIMAWVVCLLMGMDGLVVDGLGTEMVK
jgi:hypothetical protein